MPTDNAVATKKEREAAYAVIKQLRNRKQLPKPDKCARCGAPDRPASDGRSLLHTHHQDYSKPAEIVWLCVKCHRKETRLPLGERNGNAVLRANLVRAAFLLHSEGFALKDIADFYGCSRQAISHVVNGRYWNAESESKCLAERAELVEALRYLLEVCETHNVRAPATLGTTRALLSRIGGGK